jgi:hypothetical protein
VILGAAKAGTTTLYGWLLEHPDVRGSAYKELNYFSHFYHRGDDWYRAQFPREAERPFVCGEASPSYLVHLWAPQRMARLLPGVKLIVQLRDPVDRAYSHFQMRRRDGEEPLESFEAAAEAEAGRIADEHERMLRDAKYSSYRVACWSYLMRSRYVEQLERWFRHFPREQFHILTVEALAADPQGSFDDVVEFLDLPPQPLDDVHARFAFDYEPLPPATRARFEDYFRPYNERLYELLGTDLGWGRPTSDVGRADR